MSTGAKRPQKTWSYAPLSDPGPVRLALVLKTGSQGTNAVLLRSQAGTCIFLGALIDAGEQPQAWLEIWVQSVAETGGQLPGTMAQLTNTQLDAKWGRMVKAMLKSSNGVWTCGWEEKHPLPLFLNEAGVAVQPTTAAGRQWELCTDDGVLQAARLPSYSSSLDRFLHNGETGAGSCFLRATPLAPGAEATGNAPRWQDSFPGYQAINPEGGLLMVRLHAPLDFEDFIDLLSGREMQTPGRLAMELPPLPTGSTLTVHDAASLGSGAWFLAHEGRVGRLLEGFLLKLVAFHAAVQAVYQAVSSERAPFLNLEPSSFCVSLSRSSPALPALWNFDVRLSHPVESIPVPVATGEARFFLPPPSQSSTSYRSSETGHHIQGRGEFRIRKILPPDDEGFAVLEATLMTQEDIDPGRQDLLLFDLHLRDGTRCPLHAQFVNVTEARGTFRLRTLPQIFPPEVVADLNPEKGFRTDPKARFTIIPMLGTPCDLYALGVLGVRIFLTDSQQALPEALDEILTLGRIASGAASLREVVNADETERERWMQKLGPHRVLEGIDPAIASSGLPMELWWDTLDCLARCFPGVVSTSYCRTYAHFHPQAPAETFRPLLEALENLISMGRSLFTLDSSLNMEIATALSRYLV